MKSSGFVYARVPLFDVDSYYVDFLNSDAFAEALYIASRPLYNELYGYRGSHKEKANISALKYWIRSCTRCTPYGLFAGCFRLNVSKAETSIILKEYKKYKKHLRFDTGILLKIIKILKEDQGIRKKLILTLNTSIFEFQNEYRYIEHEFKNGDIKYKVSSAKKTDYLCSVIELANNGIIFNNLAKYLSDSEEVDLEEAYDYISDLLDSQILQSNLEMKITGSSSLKNLICELKRINAPKNILTRIMKIDSLLDMAGKDISLYKQIEEDLTFFYRPPENIFQLDMEPTTYENEIDGTVIDDLISQLENLSVLKRKRSFGDLEVFKVNFIKKYGNSSVPLSIVLDTEFGIGFGEHPSQGVKYDKERKRFNDPYKQLQVSEFDYIQELALSKYNDYLLSKGNCIELFDDDLKRIQIESIDLKLPNNLFALGTLLKPCQGDFCPTNYSFKLKTYWWGAANPLARFTHYNDQLFSDVRQLIKLEESEDDDCLHAEVVHLSDRITGNVVRREVLREYEIPYLGASGADDKKQINIQDIYVSVESNEIVLRSKRLNGRRIIPSLTNAHNYSMRNLLPMYKFLCMLQYQSCAYLQLWDWGRLDILKHLPRVIYKNIIIQEERWILEHKDIKIDSKEEKKKEIEALKAYLKENEIPQKVALFESSELILDLGLDRCLGILLKKVKKFGKVILKECIVNSDTCIIHDTKGKSYTNEIVIPISNLSDKIDRKHHFPNGIKEYVPPTKFFIFSEWIYFEVYGTDLKLEKFKVEQLLPFIKDHISNVSFEKFFFLHYNDPSYHIRLRFYIPDKDKRYRFLPVLLDFLEGAFKEGLVQNIKASVYEREDQRYFKNLMYQAESIFYYDSIFAMEFTQKFKDFSEDIQRCLVMRSVDQFLNDFKFTLDDKIVLFSHLGKSYISEFGGTKRLKTDINKRYRENRKDMYKYLSTIEDSVDGIIDLISLLDYRSKYISSSVNFILSSLKVENDYPENLDYLIPSYIHMSLNRLYKSDQRWHELYIYNFMEKYYKSKKAIDSKINLRI